MAARIIRSGNPYKFAKKASPFDNGLGALLPEAYKKFYYEWKETPTPVHYVPVTEKYTRNERTGQVIRQQDLPLPLKYAAEFDMCLLGGEAIIKGSYKSKPDVRRFPHFWIPNLKRTAMYSEILNQHMSVLATDRVIQLVHHHKGFDKYIMETKANDLKTKLALAIKREMIKAIHAGLPAWADEPEEQKNLLDKYKHYGKEYTAEEADWYGYNVLDATTRIKELNEAAQEASIVALKHELRQRLIEDLKSVGLQNVERVVRTEAGKVVDFSGEKKSWISKLNPFAKK